MGRTERWKVKQRFFGFYYSRSFARSLILDDPYTETDEEAIRRVRMWFRNIFGPGGIMTEIPEGTPTGGYDGEPKQQPEASSGDKLWVIVQIPSSLHGGIVAHLKCDGEPRAVLELKDEEELKWLKKRVDGLQPSPDVESRR